MIKRKNICNYYDDFLKKYRVKVVVMHTKTKAFEAPKYTTYFAG